MRAMQVVVDNSAGADGRFAEEVAAGLRERGLDVEVREPSPSAFYDTSVHFVSAGIAVRVPEQPDRALLASIEDAVRASLRHRPSERQRVREVPVHLGESRRVLHWIDVFG